MPPTLPSNFASAAAGNGGDSSNRRISSRAEGSTSGDWSRRPNGATQTFRRPSNTNHSSQSHQRDSSSNDISNIASYTGTYVPPHVNASRNGQMLETRYGRSQLLDMYRELKESGDLEHGVSDLYVGESDSEGNVGGRWSGRDDNSFDNAAGPEACLHSEGTQEPVALYDLTEEEAELFTSVNSPLKAPNQGSQRDSMQRDGPGGRKMSLSQGYGAAGLASPSSTRHVTRRREPSETFLPFSKDSGSTRTEKDDSGNAPAPLLRRRTDIRDEGSNVLPDENEKGIGHAPFSSLRRISTGPLSAGLGGPSSPWANAPQTAGPTSMGSFGSMAIGGSGQEKRLPLSGRGESRFRGLMGRQSSEDVSKGVKEKNSQSNLDRLDETAQQQTISNKFSDDRLSEVGPIGSAALGGAHDDVPFEMSKLGDLGTPSRSRFPINRMGSYGQSGDYSRLQGISERTMNQPDSNENYFPQHQPAEDPMGSPTFTNPYQSPEQQSRGLSDMTGEDPDNSNFHLPGLGGFGNDMRSQALPSFADSRNLGRGIAQSPGGSRGFGGLPGLGNIGPIGNPQTGWQTGNTAGRGLSEGFGEQGFMGPGAPFASSLGGLGGIGPYGNPPNPRTGGNGAMAQNSRLGSLFSNTIHDQMRGPDQTHRQTSGSRPEESLSESDDSYKSNRGTFDESMQNREKPGDGLQSRDSQVAPGPAIGNDQPQNQNRMQSALSGSTSAQPPAPQQKTMVMPDRIRWIYRDPQGNTQGPWSGLEMHDWYRAGFFSPELLVKKAEDSDYEPLAQLIRRIGNSREPFLVPQIGIPGPPSNPPGSTWPSHQTAPPNPATVNPAPNTAPAAQPPFPSNFPSFGTTLTAEQQNALERRKQEEQYLMARQKEHLAQQQVLVKQMQMQGGHGMVPQQLQHHSSAQSLHSQNSLGSMTGPTTGFASSTMPNQMHPGQAVPSTYDNAYRAGGMISGPAGTGADLANIDEEEASLFDRLNLSGGSGGQLQEHIDMGNTQDGRSADERRMNAALADRARLQQEQQAYEREAGRSHKFDPQRQQQFHDLQNKRDDYHGQPQYGRSIEKESDLSPEEPSLTEQVQKAASAKQSPYVGTQSPWVKGESIEVHPPAQTGSPLPAPAARRGGQNLADALVAESSQSSSPAPDPPSASLAPWAKDNAESQKQPSLKEIQEAESRRAAKQEAAAAAERRAALEREIANQAHAPAPAPGLPSSSTWGKSEPSTPQDATGSAWKPASTKTAVVQPKAPSKKTLQQIQKEEEARKMKAAAAAAVVTPPANTNAPIGMGGKRYADLASKAAAPASTSTFPTGAWTTVGASGKPKTPAAPTVSASSRPSSSTVASGTTSVAKSKTAAPSTRTTTSTASAFEDFKKWAVGELRPDLAKGIQVDDFVNALITNYPAETEIILDAVHQHSRTLDSRHFAEEFVRRKALAEKGKPQPPINVPSPASQGNEAKGGGWNEVARKTSAPTQKDENNAFKIVAAKKKGGRK